MIMNMRQYFDVYEISDLSSIFLILSRDIFTELLAPELISDYEDSVVCSTNLEMYYIDEYD